MVLEPIPNLAACNAMGRSGIGAYGLIDRREVSELSNRQGSLPTNVIGRRSEGRWGMGLNRAQDRFLPWVSSNRSLGWVGPRALSLGLRKQRRCSWRLITQVVSINDTFDFV